MPVDGRTRAGRDEQAEEGRTEEGPPPSPPDAELLDPGAPPAAFGSRSSARHHRRPPRIRSRTAARAAMAAARRRRGQLPRHLPPPVRARLRLLRRSRWVGLFFKNSDGLVLGTRVNQTAAGRFPRFKKKPVGKPVKPAGLLLLKKYRHGLLVGTGPVRVPGRTGSTGNRPNRSGSQQFG
jgi:hypothetical protein